MNNLLFILLVGLSAVCDAVASEPEKQKSFVVQEELIFPVQGDHVHGSSLVSLPNGDLLAVWFQGSGERTANDVLVMGARKHLGKDVWSTPFLMADTPGIPDCNPVLFINGGGKLFLFWIAVLADGWEHSILRYRTSEEYLNPGPPIWDWQDNIFFKPTERFAEEVEKRFKELPDSGHGWAEYAPPYDEMVIEASHDLRKRSIGWMTRIHPLTLESGRILLPLYSDGFNFSMVAISDDDGATWRPSLPIVGRGPIQPALAERENGDIVALMRDSGHEPARVHYSVSSDAGETWSATVKTDIPNTASVELLELADGAWAFFGNPIDDGRYRLEFWLSGDEGRTWSSKRIVEEVEKGKGGFSYPSMIQTGDGLVHITYSYDLGKNNKSIKHVVVDPELANRQ